MVEALYKSDLDYVEYLMDSGRNDEAYKYLYDRGYKYAKLAEGVLTESSFAGNAAIEFMKNTASDYGRLLSDSDVDAIKSQMAKGYLGALRIQLNSSVDGKVTREIDAEEARKFHDNVFDQNNLPRDSWTLTTIFSRP